MRKRRRRKIPKTRRGRQTTQTRKLINTKLRPARRQRRNNKITIESDQKHDEHRLKKNDYKRSKTFKNQKTINDDQKRSTTIENDYNRSKTINNDENDEKINKDRTKYENASTTIKNGRLKRSRLIFSCACALFENLRFNFL